MTGVDSNHWIRFTALYGDSITGTVDEDIQKILPSIHRHAGKYLTSYMPISYNAPVGYDGKRSHEYRNSRSVCNSMARNEGDASRKMTMMPARSCSVVGRRTEGRIQVSNMSHLNIGSGQLFSATLRRLTLVPNRCCRTCPKILRDS